MPHPPRNAGIGIRRVRRREPFFIAVPLVSLVSHCYDFPTMLLGSDVYLVHDVIALFIGRSLADQISSGKIPALSVLGAWEQDLSKNFLKVASDYLADIRTHQSPEKRLLELLTEASEEGQEFRSAVKFQCWIPKATSKEIADHAWQHVGENWSIRIDQIPVYESR